MNDGERNMWIDNDEGLYNWWITSGMRKKQFIRENKTDIDAHITGALSPQGRKP